MDLYCSLATGGTLLSIGRDLIENPKQLYGTLASFGRDHVGFHAVVCTNVSGRRHIRRADAAARAAISFLR